MDRGITGTWLEHDDPILPIRLIVLHRNASDRPRRRCLLYTGTLDPKAPRSPKQGGDDGETLLRFHWCTEYLLTEMKTSASTGFVT